MSANWKTWWPQVLMRWRQGRRLFDARQPNERRLIIVAVLAGIWLVFDTFWLTPGFKQMQDARKREQTAQAAAQALQTELQQQVMAAIQAKRDAENELQQVRQRLAEGQVELDRQQALLLPAREMPQLMRGLLEQNGQLRLLSMRTLAPQEVSLVADGAAAATGLPAMLYRHRLEVTVSGPYIELLRWMRSVEGMPRKLLWDRLQLVVTDPAPPALTLAVHTYSPDRDALEISP